MKRQSAIALFVMGFAALCYSPQASSENAWVTLFDGKSLDNFNKIGDANWRVEDGVIVADKGDGFLVSKNGYVRFPDQGRILGRARFQQRRLHPLYRSGEANGGKLL